MQLGAVYDAHHEGLYRYLLRLTPDTGLAEDAVQEAFLRFVERPPRDRSNVRAWLHTVATNYVFDTLKTARRRSEILASGAGEIPVGRAPLMPDSDVESADRRRVVRAALDQLREKERVTLLMRAEGFSYREIAEAVDIPANSVGAVAVRGLRKLSRILERYEAELR